VVVESDGEDVERAALPEDEGEFDNSETAADEAEEAEDMAEEETEDK
jgi:hypothetical protein